MRRAKRRRNRSPAAAVGTRQSRKSTPRSRFRRTGSAGWGGKAARNFGFVPCERACSERTMIPRVTTFTAILVTQDDGKTSASIQKLERSALPPGEVLVRIAYSSLNYKDGLAVTGRPGVIRTFPMVPGIDFAGTVEESSSADFKPGDEVVVTGCGTSETMWGGYAQLARLNAEHIVPLPQGMTLAQAMGIGTAGFTAMQSLLALEKHGLKPGGREVLVTGAAGGVGSLAVALLSSLGYNVAASTGRPELHPYLRSLGAAEILSRTTLAAPSKRP